MKRTPLKTKTPLRSSTPLKASSGKPKKCAVRTCRKPFVPKHQHEKWCSPACREELALTHLRKQQEARAKAERKAAREASALVKAAEKHERQKHREAKARLKRYSDHIAEAEKAVRDYRRTKLLLDGYGCISCGRPQGEVQANIGWQIGGAWDAGHFLSKGARPNLRMVENNIWLQCKSCNAGSSKYVRKGVTVAAQYRENLITMIGLEAVEALEADHEPRKYTIDQLEAIKKEYRARTRKLKRGVA